ncbi:Ger(x)C family spore germination protein [Paenibacillus sp. J2TS4]|uniref:Ger(x)C family spore germination protein n=1 Tax=Paenibacillus sp. J2TS4 TaxID=2807194 RepID=UPI001B127BC8|nr:Ger(x)C family spore germination protein [Paenibacillus sp. J2TS4]GIP34749.1 germination protein GerAC [Paenibacillus sp. J2TS4]
MNRPLIRILRLAFMIAACSLLTAGCWSRIEINDRAFVTAMYVDDAGEGRVKVSLGFPLPNRLVQGQAGGVSSEGNPYTHVTKEGNTIAEAVKRIQNDLPRELNWGNNRVIVISSEYAKKGILPLLEFVGRMPYQQLKTYLFVSEGEAENVPRMSAVFERFPSEVLREFARTRTTLNTTLRDLMSVHPYGGDLTIGLLRVDEEIMASEKNQTGHWVGTKGAALFKDYRLIGKFNEEQTQGALWIMNRMKSAVLKVSSPSDGKAITLDIISSQSQVKPVWKQDELVFQLKIALEAHLLASDSKLKITDPGNIVQLQQSMKDEVEKIVRQAFDESLKIGADMFKLGEIAELYYPDRFAGIKKDWQSYYARHADLKMNIQAHIKRPGGEQEPMRPEYSRNEEVHGGS